MLYKFNHGLTINLTSIDFVCEVQNIGKLMFANPQVHYTDIIDLDGNNNKKSLLEAVYKVYKQEMYQFNSDRISIHIGDKQNCQVTNELHMNILSIDAYQYIESDKLLTICFGANKIFINNLSSEDYKDFNKVMDKYFGIVR